MSAATQQYIGRFAPSPTGPLHFGSLIAAAGSYLEARRHGGRWRLRIDDIDPPREAPGAADDILRTLERFGFEWDGEVIYQSRRLNLYREALERLQREGQSFFCSCSRKQIIAAGRPGAGTVIYPGTCRGRRQAPEGLAYSVRIIAAEADIAFLDAVQGPYRQNLAREVGDFNILRRDGLVSYNLAAAIDDADGITHVVRGVDLMDTSPRQIHLQNRLGLPTPEYAHLPVAINAGGQKLSKQNKAQPLNPARRTPLLWDALAFLGQQPPPKLRDDEIGHLWDWAFEHWSLDSVPKIQMQPYRETTNARE